jgi:type VI secretion system protein ImpA
MDHTIGIEAALRTHVDAGRIPDMGGLRGILAAIRGRLESHLTKRGVAPSAAEGEAGAVKPVTESGKEKPVSGEIRSAEDVVSALEKICQYYERHEPSSPVPLLLRRAQRLVSKSFLEIIRDLSPEAKKQIENIGGVSGDAAKG